MVKGGSLAKNEGRVSNSRFDILANIDEDGNDGDISMDQEQQEITEDHVEPSLGNLQSQRSEQKTLLEKGKGVRSMEELNTQKHKDKNMGPPKQVLKEASCSNMLHGPNNDIYPAQKSSVLGPVSNSMLNGEAHGKVSILDKNNHSVFRRILLNMLQSTLITKICSR